MNGEELKRFDCTLQTISPNPNKYDFKGRAIDYYLYSKEKNEIVNIGYKSPDREVIESKTYKAHKKDGKPLWRRAKEGVSYNNYLKLTALQLQRIVYYKERNRIATFTYEKAKE